MLIRYYGQLPQFHGTIFLEICIKQHAT